LRTRLCTGASANLATGVSGQRNGFRNSACSFFKLEHDIATQIRTFANSLTLPSATTATKKISKDRSAKNIAKGFEDVANVMESTTGVVHTSVTVLIVASSLLLIS
jgi:hypothetical protein